MFLVVVRLGSVAHCLGVAHRFVDQLRDLEDILLIADLASKRNDISPGRGLQAIFLSQKPESISVGSCGVYSRSDLFDPAKNVCAAAVVWKAAGYSPWSL